nr:unnamed protein product [Callosobruchus chinensis]
MRTTPTAALEILLGLPTVPSWIRMTAIAAHLRMRDSGNWQVGGEVVGHARIARLAEEALPISAYRVVEANHLSRLDKSFTLTIPNIEMWKRGEIQFPEEALVCYTDGSRLASGQASGAGMYVENRGVRESYSLGTNTTIFEAEVYAILSAACNEETLNYTVYKHLEKSEVLWKIANRSRLPPKNREQIMIDYRLLESEDNPHDSDGLVQDKCFNPSCREDSIIDCYILEASEDTEIDISEEVQLLAMKKYKEH